ICLHGNCVGNTALAVRTPFAVTHAPNPICSPFRPQSKLVLSRNSARKSWKKRAHVQSLMLPAEVLCAGPVTIAHEFEPVDIVGGDFVDYFLMDNLCRKHRQRKI